MLEHDREQKAPDLCVREGRSDGKIEPDTRVVLDSFKYSGYLYPLEKYLHCFDAFTIRNES